MYLSANGTCAQRHKWSLAVFLKKIAEIFNCFLNNQRYLEKVKYKVILKRYDDI